MAITKYSYGKLSDQLEIIVADNDPVSAHVQLNNDFMDLVILFVPTPNPDGEDIRLAWRFENEIVHFTFYGWKNSLGTTTSQVNTSIGSTLLGEPVYIAISHHLVGEANHLTMQFIVGQRAGV